MNNEKRMQIHPTNAFRAGRPRPYRLSVYRSDGTVHINKLKN